MHLSFTTGAWRFINKIDVGYKKGSVPYIKLYGTGPFLYPTSILFIYKIIWDAVCPQVFSSGGTCTLLPSFLWVHPNFWGCNVPSNSSFGGTKKMNCIFSTQGRAPCCFL
jgi:hypothetical protein